MQTVMVSHGQSRREVFLNVYGSDGNSLLGTLPGDAMETVGEVVDRRRLELGFSEDGPLCLSRRIRAEGREDWESIPDGAKLGEIAVNDQADVAVDEDAQLGLA